MAEQTATGEKIYTIPFRKDIIKTRRIGRANRTVNIIKGYLLKHTRANDVKISRQLNDAIWASGAKKPPHKLKVKVKLDGEAATAMLPEEIGVEKKVKTGKISAVTERLKGRRKDKEEKKKEEPEKTRKEEKPEKKSKTEGLEPKRTEKVEKAGQKKEDKKPADEGKTKKK
jgi:large subunit ribosomal protein L31e